MISVIGAGPSGNYFASLMSKDNEVEVYENHKVIGRPIQCTGIITGALDEVIKVNKEFMINYMDKIRIFSENQEVEMKIKKDYVVDRDKFDYYLAKSAMKNGAEYKLGKTFVDFKEGNKKIKMKFNDNSFEETDYLIGADGPFSSVAKAAGIYGEREFVAGIQGRYKIKSEKHTFEVFLNEGEGYFGWSVPENEEIARIGITAKRDAKNLFDNLIKKREGKLIEWQSGPIPIYNPKLKTGKGRVFLLGDAATMVKPTTYGGIIQGMMAAEELKKAIHGDLDYEKLWKKRIGKDLMIHTMIRRVLDRFSNKDYDELIRLVKQEKIKEILEEVDRDHPSKMMAKLLINEPRFLKFGFKMI